MGRVSINVLFNLILTSFAPKDAPDFSLSSNSILFLFLSRMCDRMKAMFQRIRICTSKIIGTMQNSSENFILVFVFSPCHPPQDVFNFSIRTVLSNGQWYSPNNQIPRWLRKMFQTALMPDSGNFYLQCIKISEAALVKYIRIIEGMKDLMCNLASPERSQLECYSGHKRETFLVYIYISTSVGLVGSAKAVEDGIKTVALYCKTSIQKTH